MSAPELPEVKTALQRHASFFDPAGTGLVTMGQTYAGMGRLGVRTLWKVLLTPVINLFLSILTKGPLLVIAVDRIADGKHPYDSGTFDDHGEVDERAFEALFEAYGDAITSDEMRAVITARGNRKPGMGRLAGALGRWFSGREVGVFFCVAADTRKTVNGKSVPAVRKETFRRFYDGTLFPDLARRRILAEAGCVVRLQGEGRKRAP
jgi:hypothetical protein